jgi:hypothetical protein
VISQGDISLAFSKESSLGLPIVKTRITGTQPCLDPKQNHKGNGNLTFWMSELAWLNRGWAGCEPIWVTGKKQEGELSFDNRYK